MVTLFVLRRPLTPKWHIPRLVNTDPTPSGWKNSREEINEGIARNQFFLLLFISR